MKFYSSGEDLAKDMGVALEVIEQTRPMSSTTKPPRRRKKIRMVALGLLIRQENPGMSPVE